MAASIADIKKLRELTGAGLSACKDALNETNGDFEAAKEIIRKKGQAIAAKRSDRTAAEGYVLAGTKGNRATLIALQCETDFVAKTDRFVNLAKAIYEVAENEKPADIEALRNMKIGNDVISQLVTDNSGATGEKLELNIVMSVEGESVFAYNHFGNKLGCIVAFNQANVDAEVMKQVAMQIAAMNPVAVKKEEVPADIIAEELKIAREKAIEAGKPENMIDRIAEGALNKYYKEYCLLDQAYNVDPKISMAQYMDKASKGLTVTAFKRFNLNAE